MRQAPRSCNAVQPLVNRPVRSPLLAQRPLFRTVQPRKQHQNRGGPDNSDREYQRDRFLGAHTAILCLGRQAQREVPPSRRTHLPNVKGPAEIGPAPRWWSDRQYVYPSPTLDLTEASR